MIKTFEEACEKLGGPLVEHYNIINQSSIKYRNDKDDIIAYLKLRIICSALNEGWEPDYTNESPSYVPWFLIYNSEDIEELELKERKKLIMRDNIGICFGGTEGSYHAIGNGVRLCLKTTELSDYCGKQFLDIWADYILPKK